MGYLLSIRLPDWIVLRIDDRQTAKGQWNQLIEELRRLGHKDIPIIYAPEGVAHSEPDSTWEEAKTNTPAHLEGAGPDTLMEEEDDHLLKVEEEEAARKAASVEGDVGPRVELQDPGVSCLSTQENAGSHTLPSPMPPTTPQAASTQPSLAVNAGTQATPVADHGADLEPQPHDTPPPPNEGAEPPTHQPPKQIRAPTKVEGPLPGEESQRATGQRGPRSAQKHEGKTPIGEAHGRPPDLPNPQRQSSIDWEPVFIIPKARVRVHKAQRPILDKGACTCPDPWPDLGAITVDPDIYFGSASQLEGEQNFHLPCVGSELHAAPSPPQNFPSSFSPFPPPDTPARENPSHGEGAATERCIIEDHPRPGPQKPPDPHAEDLQETGGALSASGNVPVILEGPDPFRLAGAVVNVDLQKVEPSCDNAHERGGALLVAGVALALAEGTASVEPAGKAEKAIAARPKALVPWAQDKAKRRHEVNKPPHKALPQKGERNAEALSRKRKPERPEALPPGGERKCGMMPQGNSNKAQREPDRLSREPSREEVLSTQEGPGPWDPRGPPGERITGERGPVEAKKTDAAGIVAHKKNLAMQKRSQSNGDSNSSSHAPLPISHRPMLSSRIPLVFVLRPIERARRRPGSCKLNKHCNATVWWPSHSRHMPSHAPPHHARTGALAEKLNVRPQTAEYNHCTPPYLFGSISLQCPDCLRNEGECCKWHARADRLDHIWTLTSYIP